MTHALTTGNSIKPLRNVAALTLLATELIDRTFGLPGLGVFHGPSGLGKSFASASVCASLDAIHISVESDWTASMLYFAILAELGVRAKGTVAEKSYQCKQELMRANRLLILDEADYLIKKRASPMIERVRDIHDKAGIPIILVGMEELPQKLRQWEQVDNRIYRWVGAERADMQDAQMLADHYAPSVEISADLLDHIRTRNDGVVRKMAMDFAYVAQQSQLMSLATMSLDQWGGAPFLRNEAPRSRRVA
ncbi:AAA family ATPase [Pacificibacter marinus]|uniref:AAA family ATPase n=1 Tax=Pacificibacter marinus TaxID=658057 RepID=UPI001C06F3D4|nr:ATP-binding protein [Pacificibacter marinus]MBU2867115.1 ATP-binding protein [Pacificibacter marinus]